jgi:hypothetical protein
MPRIVRYKDKKRKEKEILRFALKFEGETEDLFLFAFLRNPSDCPGARCSRLKHKPWDPRGIQLDIIGILWLMGFLTLERRNKSQRENKTPRTIIWDSIP